MKSNLSRTRERTVLLSISDLLKTGRMLFTSGVVVMLLSVLPSRFSSTTMAIGADDDESQKMKIAWFENKVRPLLAAKCYSCHAARDGKDEGGLTLDTKRGWATGGDQGRAIVPGDLEASLLIRAVRYKDSDLEMPPDRRLADSEIAILERWVKLGAPDPRTGETAAKPKNDPSDPVAGKEHWAFQPLKRPTVRPTEKMLTALGMNHDQIRSPIDYFVLQKLVDNGLKPNRLADRRTLARRLYIALTGLPPTTTEIDEFLSDQEPDSYERLVDRLLAADTFGESWGRHWLDLARYADSNGLDENFLFREAWRYRNWVIDAVNSDQPYDRFLLEQIAGDLLPFESVEERDRQRIGAGFLVIGPKVLLGVNGEQQRMDVADEQIDTVGRVFLGQTLGCARCHDHKFDPIPTKDYYAMAGVFASTQVMQMRYMLGQQRLMERLVGLGEEEDTINVKYEKYWRERGKLQGRLDQGKKALELLKKKETKLLDLKSKFASALADEVKRAIQKEIDFRRPAPPFPFDEFEPLSLEARVALQTKFVDELQRQFDQPPPIPPRAMIPADATHPKNEPIRIAGQFDRKGELIDRGFLQVLSREAVSISEKRSGRLELARWLTDRGNDAAHLSARVMVNRVWRHLVGEGIVKTTDNFGRTGQAPSHPQLLEYLATDLLESNWSIKNLIRTVVLSHTFMRSSDHNASANEIDPDNRLVWRANRRRLTPEAFRDSILVAADELNRKKVESTVGYLGDQATAVGANTNRRKTDYSFRSVYLPVIRNDLPELFEVFDFADAHRATGNRPDTTVATQGLYVLNDDWVMKMSRKLAGKLMRNTAKSTALPSLSNDVEKVKTGGVPSRSNDLRHQDANIAEQVYLRIFNEPATESEVRQLIRFTTQMQEILLVEHEIKRRDDAEKDEHHRGNDPSKSKESDNAPGNTVAKMKSAMATQAEMRMQAWAMVCHAMFASSRFQILE